VNIHKKPKSFFYLLKKKITFVLSNSKITKNMRTLKNLFLFAIFSLMAGNAFAQGTVKGTVLEAKSNDPLPGADVVLVGTTTGVATDFDGNFVLNVPAGTQKIQISSVGYATKVMTVTVKNGQVTNLGKIALTEDAQSLSEVVIVGVADIAKERQTPVAVSTLKAAEIQERIGTKELPEILNNTPSIYATKQGGGYGDARVNIRGFDSRNTAVLINGMPVNDMESGKVYWSNWAGLGDVTSAMQVQRGLGSSMLAIPSVGGTINILTNSANKKQGGTVAATVGTGNFMKFTASYNTGLMKNGLSTSILLSQFSGDGYADATQGQGYTWFVSMGYKLNDKHKLMFTATGAPQWHNQRYYAPSLDSYLKYGGSNGEPNIKYNGDWGYLNGEVFTWRRNFYHKPIASVNWDWKISDDSKLTSVFYGSWGRGGGTGPIGRINGKAEYKSQFKDENGLYRFDDIVTWNTGGHVADFGADRAGNAPYINERKLGFTRRASMNSHDWYGTIIKYKKDINDNFNLVGGIDARMYKGYHYRVVNNTLGADAYNNTYKDKNNIDNVINPADYIEANASWNPFSDILGQQKIEYFSVGNVRWIGGFTQAEYTSDKYSAFIAGGLVSQQFQREDYFNYLDNDPEQISEWVSMNGFNVKGGANYNINDKHNVFFSAGINNKPAQFGAVFPYYTNKINEDLTNEKITSFELGYGFKGEHWKVNINAYQTKWADRYKVASDRNTHTSGKLNGLTEIHKGLELETKAKYGPVKITGMLSLNDWTYSGDIKGVKMVDDNNDVIFTQDFYLDDVKVGNSAQTTAALGINYNAFKGFYLNLNQRYVDNLYANIDALSFKDEDNKGSLKLPSYSLVDASATYKFKVNKVGKITTRFTINNLFDKIYISESATNKFAEAGDETWNGVNTSNRVFFGWGRAWNFSVKLKF
jgi:outer membrane cobalamin receptor